MTKLNWADAHTNSAPGYTAKYKGLTIRAEHDSCPSNPFEDWDGHWPMMARHDGSFTTYDKVKGTDIDAPLCRFSDELLVHLQHHIAKVFGITVQEMLENRCDGWDGWDWPSDEDGNPVYPKHCTDASTLTEAFDCELSDVYGSQKLAVLGALYDLLDIPNLVTSSHGYCQGDYTELLIVATPEAQAELRSQPADMDDETWAKMLNADMEGQRDLYGAWAWGNVYGYVVEDANGEEIDSCWGYYGSEFDESGLEEAALDAADHHLASMRRKRADKLKQLIASRVPLVYRPELLEMAA